MNDYEGSFISIEGLDKSGKSTAIEGLQWRLGNDYEFTQEPSYGKYGQILRSELRSDSDPTASDFFLFCADRFDHCESLIGPKLDKGKNVITDRYTLSTYAYQSEVIEDEMNISNPIEYIDETITNRIIEPDLTIYLYIPLEDSLKRIGESEKYETRQTLKNAKEIYDRVAEERDNVEIVDATRSREKVVNECYNIIRRYNGD